MYINFINDPVQQHANDITSRRPPKLKKGPFSLIAPQRFIANLFKPPENQFLLRNDTCLKNGNRSSSELNWKVFAFFYLEYRLVKLLGHDKYRVDKNTHYSTATYAIVCVSEEMQINVGGGGGYNKKGSNKKISQYIEQVLSTFP